jgi:hypothetical protein
LTTNFRINYPETGRFETSDWLWCNGAQHPLTRFESVDCLGGRGSGIEVRILINQQMVVKKCRLINVERRDTRVHTKDR